MVDEMVLRLVPSITEDPVNKLLKESLKRWTRRPSGRKSIPIDFIDTVLSKVDTDLSAEGHEISDEEIMRVWVQLLLNEQTNPPTPVEIEDEEA